MLRALVIVVLIALGPLSESEIDQAIAEGRAMKDFSGAILGRGAAGQFRLNLQGPRNRIANAAKGAKGQYRAFTPADVTEEQKAAVLRVAALPVVPTWWRMLTSGPPLPPTRFQRSQRANWPCTLGFAPNCLASISS